MAKPTLVITGTDDNDYMPHGNALILASKIPGAWLAQVKNAGHAVMNQYPEEIGKMMNTFLSTRSTTFLGDDGRYFITSMIHMPLFYFVIVTIERL